MEDVAKKSGAEFLHVPYKGSTEATQAVLGGHVVALASSSGWGRLVDSGQLKLLVTFSAQRAKRWPTVPTANDLGLEMVYDSPYGVVGPRNMEPGVVKTLHDVFKQAVFDPEHQKVLDQLDQELWYRSSEDYARYARETFPKERALVQRLGMLVQ
jgi:tripartite-type tricarboxylate transporter receptor subunit TctC